MPSSRVELQSRPTKVRYQVLASLSLMAAIAYLQRQVIAVVAEPLQADLQITKTQVGSIMSSFFVGYALFQIPSGWLADHWGTRKSLTLFAFAWSLSAGGMALASNYFSALALWFLAGSAQAGAFPCAARSIRAWMPGTRRGIASGVLGSCMSLGGAVSTLIAGKLSGRLDWRLVLLLLSLPGIAWAVSFAWWFRDLPTEHAATNPAERQLIAAGQPDPTSGSLPSSTASGVWFAMFKSGSTWAICGQQFFRAAAYIFFATWFPSYLEESRGVSLSAAGQLTALPLIAVVIGSPLGGIVSDWLLAQTGNRRISRCLLAAVSLAVCAGLIVAAYFVAEARAAVLIISGGAFCAAVGGVGAYTITMDLGGGHVATLFSLMNMCGNIGAAIFPFFVGLLLDHGHSWDHILLLFATLYAAAATCWILVNPARPIFPLQPGEESG